ncbi:16S rRNA (cytidine(1402)-2'-O)-methyltransferase [Thalassobacillus sp. CUG 92003]|uniref:16S rRNA (cytidine(1402)-2'-O)-methyltransferase n=1 Tax=Thalassobacillus sp. CUG 92003 TaxID=2736641 RepID=UPI0015E6EC54|nr:16S rRNA (cytidine(1402)-2'-O)-methyltransferase [Thalassobacillus sp. CUG 92003]
MKIQKSFAEAADTGRLYLVPTPIGNLEDMTFRAVACLKEADVIAAEDTRNTRKLLNHFEIDTPMLSYHEHNKYNREAHILDRLSQGEQIALVSDAGMPGISDPGADIVSAAIGADYPVIALPGANAVLPALVGSGLLTDTFQFYGFLPRKKKDRTAELEGLQSVPATLVFYESPHRLKEMLSAVRDVFGNRNAAIARELTKRYEEYIRGTLEELVAWSQDNQPRGEFCIVVEGGEPLPEAEAWWQELTLKEHVERYMAEAEMSSKQAIKQTAQDRELPKREVYQAYHID